MSWQLVILILGILAFLGLVLFLSTISAIARNNQKMIKSEFRKDWRR